MISAGYYGKIPARGDFVKHQLPRSFVEPWDDWLQSAIHRSREQLGDKWLDVYLTSPIYRFLLSSGVCGSKQWMGVFMPSVDQIGRYFPMTLCIPTPSSDNIFSTLKSSEDWFTKAEGLVANCLEDEFNLDDFNHSISELSMTAKSASDYEDKQIPMPSDSGQMLIRQAVESQDGVNHVYPEILDATLKQSCFAYSLWSTRGSERISSSLLISQGLPAVDAFQALFTGDWKDNGWLDNQVLPDLDITNNNF